LRYYSNLQHDFHKLFPILENIIYRYRMKLVYDELPEIHTISS
jgi:hypothetical protein